MKVLFLDIDGVVNSKNTTQRHGSFIGIDPYLAFLVGKIQLDTGCGVVLSSAWRLMEDGKEEVRKKVVNFIDCTKSISDFRGDEVDEWLERHPEVEKYAILDDNSDFYPDQNLFKTSWDTGITEEIAEQVTSYSGRL